MPVFILSFTFKAFFSKTVQHVFQANEDSKSTVCGLIIYPTLVGTTKAIVKLSIFIRMSRNLEVW